MYAQDVSGRLVEYYYLDNRNLPNNLQVQENQLYSFAPLPANLENTDYLHQVSGTQSVENYFPRYSSGAFSNQKETFLYPNAKNASNLYNSRTNGFPMRIKFVLTMREESVREIFGKYYISNDGQISTTPSYVGVVRPSINNDINLSQITPVMQFIFQPNSNYFKQQYDFNNFPTDAGFEYSVPVNMVDNNWSPAIYRTFSQDTYGHLIKNILQNTSATTNYYVPSGKNSFTYTDTDSPFFQGIRLTGDRYLTNKIYNGTGDDNYTINYSEAQKHNGLFHYYSPLVITGYLLYTPPIYNIESGDLYINDAIQRLFLLW
jgi:hypothetical protein